MGNQYAGQASIISAQLQWAGACCSSSLCSIQLGYLGYTASQARVSCCTVRSTAMAAVPQQPQQASSLSMEQPLLPLCGAPAVSRVEARSQAGMQGVYIDGQVDGAAVAEDGMGWWMVHVRSG